MSKESRELKIEIYGIVQGINLRRRVEKYAKSLGVTGYVENLKDGGIKIVAQGDSSQLDELLAWAQKPPFLVQINGMSYSWALAGKEYKSFRIKKSGDKITDQIRSFVNLGKEVVNWSQPAKVPEHVVIIPDGNRRWAREKGWHPWIGHRKSMAYDRFKGFVQECRDLNVKYLSFWGFSTENWNRDEDELDVLWDLYRKNVGGYWRKLFAKEGVRFRHMGRKDRLPKDIINDMQLLQEETKDNINMNFQFCLDYGGRDDLVRGINKMIKDGIESVDEELISSYLDSKGIPDPDLIIRTSGEKRTSGIMAYQATYAELYFTNVYFPDFGPEQLRMAILDYSARVRRFGGTADADLDAIDIDSLENPDVDIQTGKVLT